jgi:flagellar hook protein FlgE
LAVTTQDGAPPGTLNSFTVGEDGMIRGVFSNGVTRDLAQVVLAQFSNPSGLAGQGQNLYASGVNSGTAALGNPGQNGAGSIVGGATELSNTDVGSNLVDLILASTMYRGNAQVVTTVQQLYQTLLTLNTA